MGWKAIFSDSRLSIEGLSEEQNFTLKVSDDGDEWKDTLHIGAPQGCSCTFVLRGCSFAHARYFRFVPHNKFKEEGNLEIKCRVGLLVLDDQGAHLVGPRYVRDHSPLHIAAKAGDVKMIKMLLDHGADPEMRAGCWQAAASQTEPCGGKTALQLAAAASSLPAVQALVDHGATVHEHSFAVPKGKEGDLVAGYLQTNGSKPVARI